MARKDNRRFYRSTFLGCVSLCAIITAQQTRAQETTPIPNINVTAPSPPSENGTAASGPLMDGSAAAGYRVQDTTAAGPIWNDLPIQDAPYSISVVPAPLIENQQAYNIEELFKIIPQITNWSSAQNAFGSPFSGVYVRGFQIGNTNLFNVQYVDGMGGGAGGIFFPVLEDKENVQLLSGVTAFLYGNSNSLGGVINMDYKRPTATPLFDVTVGDNAGANGYIHGDFGGPLNFPGIDPDVFGYRLNLVGQDGYTSIYDQVVKRDLASLALDVHMPYGILLQFNVAHSNYKIWGLTPQYEPFVVPYPAPANPAQIFNPNYVTWQDQTDTAGVKLTWKLNDIFTVRSEYNWTRDAEQDWNGVNNYLFDYSGTLEQAAFTNSPPNVRYVSTGYTFMDADFSTWDIKHKLTAGFTGFTQTKFLDACQQPFAPLSGSGPTNTSNFYHQSSYNYPYPGIGTTCFPASTSAGYAGVATEQYITKNYILGDQITAFDDRLIILAGGTYTALGGNYFNATPTSNAPFPFYGTTPIPGLGVAELTPSASVIYKVVPWISTYFTYQQGLVNGHVVESEPGMTFSNSGAVIAPYLTTQYEAGVKATVGTNLLVTAALFDLEEANELNVRNPDGTFTDTQSGREVHKGLELTATGRVAPDITIFGGLTLLDPRVINATTLAFENGLRPPGVSSMSEKLYMEYDLPYLEQAPWLRGLTLTGGFQYVGPYNNINYNTTPFTLFAMPGYVVGDLGFRYTTPLYGHPFTLRFNVTNFTNHAYWQNAYFEGPPRTFLASAEMKW
ncbi:MAG TPA: TonB-dependent receptor plug domain-containing protein [Methylocella sp.]|nr:TonB-dependent receptor plug domain-containing protein [Methylocella sp.]